MAIVHSNIDFLNKGFGFKRFSTLFLLMLGVFLSNSCQKTLPEENDRLFFNLKGGVKSWETKLEKVQQRFGEWEIEKEANSYIKLFFDEQGRTISRLDYENDKLLYKTIYEYKKGKKVKETRYNESEEIMDLNKFIHLPNNQRENSYYNSTDGSLWKKEVIIQAFDKNGRLIKENIDYYHMGTGFEKPTMKIIVDYNLDSDGRILSKKSKSYSLEGKLVKEESFNSEYDEKGYRTTYQTPFFYQKNECLGYDNVGNCIKKISTQGDETTYMQTNVFEYF